jgi:hypothetical protein
MRTLLENSKQGEEMRRLVANEAKRRQRSKPGHNSDRMGHQAHLALVAFIERESRLPTKNELNVEVCRMRKPVLATTHHPTSLPYGEKKLARSGHPVRVRNCRKNFELPIDGLGHLFQIDWVDDKDWNEPMWGKETFRDVLKTFGFSGLSKSKPKNGGNE